MALVYLPATETIPDPRTPMTSFSGSDVWAVLNLVFVGTAVLFALALMLWYLFETRKGLDAKTAEQDSNLSADDSHNVESENKNSSKRQIRLPWCLASTGVALLAVLAFLLTQDIKTAVVFIDIWTPFMLLLLAVQGLFVYAALFGRLLNSSAEKSIRGRNIRHRVNIRYD